RDGHVTGVQTCALPIYPGIGFGKTLEHNLSLLKNLPRLRVNNRPLVVGVSRKSFLGKISGHNGSIHHRLLPTVAFTSLLRMNGRSEERRVGKECRCRRW